MVLVVAPLVLSALVPEALATPVRQTGPEAQQQTPQGTRTLTRDDLSSPNPPRLSGLTNFKIVATYSQGADPAEVLLCDSSGDGASLLRFSVDGSSPAPSPHTVTAQCPSSSAIASTIHTYEWTISKTQLDVVNTPTNALFRFKLEIARRSGTDTARFPDDNGGLFYNLRLDRSGAVLVSPQPAPKAGSSVPDPVTTDTRPQISFGIQDVAGEAPIVPSTVGISINAVNRTALFDCIVPDPFRMDCSIDWARAGAFALSQNATNTFTITGRDQAGNNFGNSPNGLALRIRVDRQSPYAKDIVARPNSGDFTNNPPITARGVQVTVTATVKDDLANLDTNCANCVFVQFFNRTAVPAVPDSPLFPMTFDSASSKWRTTTATIPSTWPANAFGVRARIVAVDQANNPSVNETTADQFILDPLLPTVTHTPIPAFILDKDTDLTARATDLGTGVKSVLLTYTNTTGSFKHKHTAPPTGHKLVPGTNNKTFNVTMTKVGNTDNYTAKLPAANNNTIITYNITVEDKAGNKVSTPLHTTQVDLNPPTILEVAAAPIRGVPPIVLTFDVRDPGVGVNESEVKVYFSTGGGFTPITATKNAAATTYSASLNFTATNGQEVRYYAEAKDKLGNLATYNTSASPRKFTVDTQAPTFQFTTVPANSTGPEFTVEWNATDSLAGVATYTIQARLREGSVIRGDWITVADNVTTTSLAVCGRGGFTYEFRGYATDKVGNAGSLPAEPMGSTALSGAGCVESVAVTVVSPSAGQILDGSAGNATVLFSAASTRTLTPTSQLRISIEFSPDNGIHYFLLHDNLTNTGNALIDVSKLPSCTQCLLRVKAATLSDVRGEDVSDIFRIRNGDQSADFDGNGLSDEWEIRYASQLGVLNPDDDLDKDGLSNAEESAVGSNPNSKDTDGDGVSDRLEVRAGRSPTNAADFPSKEEAREDQFTNLYWGVPAAFLATTIVFFIGLARRW